MICLCAETTLKNSHLLELIFPFSRKHLDKRRNTSPNDIKSNAKNIHWLLKAIDLQDQRSTSGEQEEGAATEEDQTRLLSVSLAGPDHVPF